MMPKSQIITDYWGLDKEEYWSLLNSFKDWFDDLLKYIIYIYIKIYCYLQKLLYLLKIVWNVMNKKILNYHSSN